VGTAIVPEFPKRFAAFKKKEFTLLWRGRRDGCGVRGFWIGSDGHPNPLTVILDTDGDIFGFLEISCDLLRLQTTEFDSSLVWQPRWIESETASSPLRRAPEHSDCDFGHGREYIRRIHQSVVGVADAKFHD
jgi:hypothetical protein